MKRSHLKSLVVLNFISVFPVVAQSNIIGTVASSTGEPIPGAIVSACDIPPGPAGLKRRPAIVLGTAATAKTGRDGSFRIMGLPTGDYFVCASFPGTDWLDTCEWSAAIPIAKVGSTKEDIRILVPAEKGKRIQVGLSYPPGFSKSLIGKRELRTMLIAVWSQAHRGPALMDIDEEREEGRTHSVLVPAGVTHQLRIRSQTLTAQDKQGKPIDLMKDIPIEIEEIEELMKTK